MSDPKRWCDDPAALQDRERQVLLADARLNPPPQAKAEIWAGLVQVVSTGGAALSDGDVKPSSGSEGPGHGTASAGHGLSLGSAIKLALVGIGIGTSVAVVGHTFSQSNPEVTPTSRGTAPSNPAPSVASSLSANKAIAPTPPPEPDRLHRVNEGNGVTKSGGSAPIGGQNLEPSPAPGSDIRDLNPEPTTSARTTTGSVAGFAPESPSAREESQLIAAARAALRAGNGAFALQLLDRAEGRFPQGILVQEREALRVESLAALGRTAEARTRADAFVRAYPNSPHLGRVRGYATQ